MTTGDGNSSSTNNTTAATQVGATWADNLKAGNLKLDLDNLLSSKANKLNAPAPSMNALKVQSPNMPQTINHHQQQQQQVPLTIQTPTMGNFAAFGAQTTPGISPGLGNVGGNATFFNTTSPNIPSQQQQQTPSQFANFNQMMMPQQQPSPKPQKGFVSNNNNNVNNNLQSFDLFQ